MSLKKKELEALKGFAAAARYCMEQEILHGLNSVKAAEAVFEAAAEIEGEAETAEEVGWLEGLRAALGVAS